jgi:hypothetical protein
MYCKKIVGAKEQSRHPPLLCDCPSLASGHHFCVLGYKLWRLTKYFIVILSGECSPRSKFLIENSGGILYASIQGVSRLYGITAGGDFLCLCDQKSSYKHVSDFGRLWSYGRFFIPIHALVWTVSYHLAGQLTERSRYLDTWEVPEVWWVGMSSHGKSGDSWCWE